MSRQKPPPSTISDKDWRALQARAAKANPRMADAFSDEAAARRLAAAEQQRKRHQS